MLDLDPRRIDALPESRRAGLGLPEHAAVAARDQRSRGRATPIHTDQKLDHDRLRPSVLYAALGALVMKPV